MLQWLLAPLILLSSLFSIFFPIFFSGPCYGISTSSGPTSDEEAIVLWETGEAALAESRNQDAINAFQRYLDRYPGSPHYLKAQLELGKAFIEQNANQQAVFVLKNFISACHHPSDSVPGRLLLGHVYLRQNQFQQALLIAIEVRHIQHEKHLSFDILLESSLIQTEALLGLGHLDRATQMLHGMEQQINEATHSKLKGQIYALALQLKISDCTRLPSLDRLDEAQLRDQLDRRGTCLLESLLLYRKTLQANDLKSATLATQQVIHSFNQYADSCSSKLPPPHAPQRSLQELKRYHAELTDRLTQDCRQKWSHALELVESWKADLPPAMLSALLQSSHHFSDFLSHFLSSRTP